MIKKIIIIFLCLMVSGCYDYQEINEIAIVSGIGIDYIDDKYNITYELINIKSSNEEQDNDEKKYIVNSDGDNIVDAVINIENKITKNVSYSHLSLLLISNKIARKGIDDIIDFFIRNSKFSNNFYLVTTLSNKPSNVLEYSSISNPISSKAIVDLLMTTNSTITYNNKDTFDYQIANAINNNDIAIPNIKLDKEIELDGMSIFKKLEYNFKLNDYETQIYGLLNNKIKNNLIFNKDGAIEIDKSNIKIDYLNNEFIFNISIEAKIKKINDNNFNLKNNDYLNNLEESFINTINNRSKELIKRTINNDSDIFNLKDIIFKKTNNKNDDWHKDFIINTKLHINRSGTLFEVLS